MQIFDIIKKWSSRFLEDTTRMQQLQISEHIQPRDPAVERSLQSCKLWKLKVQLQHPASFEEASPTQQRREHNMSRGAHGPPRCNSGRSRGEIPVSSKCKGCTIQQEVKQAYEWKVGGRNSRLFQLDVSRLEVVGVTYPTKKKEETVAGIKEEYTGECLKFWK
ncbi:hypothetical protein LR48_Vigan08g069100 [Vigna angularis]|uniref:Uncharacterized protein n=1 Tax=Phaseolus angularis TaxID=3914 RepID=A0A0L9V583_PHAAN|nr:hypothetical protein LR48_Vigan08g069100 [Vigna angularis]